MRGNTPTTLVKRIRQRVKRFIYNPTHSRQEIMMKETLFYWAFFTFVGNFGSLILTTLLDAFPMVVFSYVMAGGLLISLFLYSVPLNFAFAAKVELYSTILVSLVFSGWMGGPMDSGGLIFIGIYCIFMSAPFRDLKMTAGLTLFYIAGLVTLVILDPYLDVHPAMTPQSNYIMFLVKLTWLTSAQIIFLVYYFKESNRYELREKARLEELNQTKNHLFTNISHEIRTPITLMIGGADQIPPRDNLTEKAIHRIKNNGKRLLRLVNQMLSLAKLESAKIELNNVQADIIRFIEFIVHTFQSLAVSRDIRLEFHTFSDSYYMDFDPDRVEEVISNLISNALRYTQVCGKVSVDIDLVEESDALDTPILRIEVKDNGVGIPKDKLDLVFDRFYQVDIHPKHNREGSGIGLTLVRENIKLMGGSIEVQSTDGIGTCFTTSLPVRRQAPVQSNLDFKFEELLPVVDQKSQSDLDAGMHMHGDHLPMILIVEDHEDMVDYIQSILKGEYRIITAFNGSEGLDLTLEYMPDIIISDVMMPVMDGLEFLQKLRNDIRTSHIPVIMLTAKADMQSKLEGLIAGAEAYLTKPFDKNELKVRLKSILDQRAILHEQYLTSILLESMPGLNETESAFKQQLHEILLANLDNPKFNIGALVRQLGMSRTQLYKKVKALTNTTVDKYIRKFRLHQSVHLLKSTDLTVSQVALEVGMPNQSYFSRAFKEEFGHSPSEVAAVS